MLELVTPELVLGLLRRHQDALTLSRVGMVGLDLIGRGEANLNLRVRLEEGPDLNLRIGLRGDESVAALHREFSLLRVVPGDVGPRAFVQDSTGADLPYPYLLLEYLAGDISPHWPPASYDAHARTLARLHMQAYDRHGDLDSLTTEPFDMLARFDAACHYWNERTPELFELPFVPRLRAAIRQYIVARRTHFTSLPGFSLVHGDAHWRNILLYEGRARYIDWEWATIGDPACDVAKVGWDVATAWQFALTGEQLEGYLDTYLALRPDPTLRARREVWMVFTMFFDQLYHRTRLGDDRSGQHRLTVQQLERYLTERFL
jgi:aminoglycoside phosphotransferase (APT) family kinase protein